MRSPHPTPLPRRRGEAGFTIIEVLVAALLLTLASAAIFGALAAATRNGARAKATQVALDRAQQEMEKLHSVSFEDLALEHAPAASSNPLSPNHRVVNGSFALQREPASEYAPMVVNVEGEKGIKPGPIKFEEGEVTGTVYRYIVWRNDTSCPERELGEGSCQGFHAYKQLVVAVKLDSTESEPREHGYVEVQSAVLNPDLQAAAPKCESGKCSGGGGSENGGGGSGGTGSAVTAQQFFLTDTPCSAGGMTIREEITGNHLLHDTLGTCASGPQTGATPGAPDALLLGAPPDPAPEDETNPPLYDYSNDSYLEATPETDKGVQIRRDDKSGCNYEHKPQEGTIHPESEIHRWVSDPFAADFKMSGKVTLEFYTRALNDGNFHGTLCVYLFDRHETGSGEATVATDSLLKDKSAVGNPAYWVYTPQGNGFWPESKWAKVRLSMEFLGAPYTIPTGDRLGVALSVEPGNTDAEAIPIVYDHPDYPTRIEVDTTTPTEGG
jgi:Tfp pilus assembly protein PilE